MSRTFMGTFAVAMALAAWAPLVAAPGSPNEDVYTVANYPVDARAANAVAAKEKALASGQQAAFRSLLKRIVPVTDYERLKRLASLRSSDFFEGVSVRSERNSSTRYIANLDFSFRADSVRAVLKQEGIPFVEEQAREVTVVPAVRDAQGAIDSGRSARAWTSIWKGLDLEHTLTPIGLQPVKPDISADTLKAISEGRGVGSSLAEAYGGPYVVVALAEPDAAARRLNVTLVGVDAVGPLRLRRSYRVYDGDIEYAMELAAVVAQGVLEGRWKVQRTAAGSAAAGTPVSLSARYASLGEWRDMRRQLLDLPGVSDLRIDAESAQGASLSLRFPGGANALATAVSTRGLALESWSGGLVLRSAP